MQNDPDGSEMIDEKTQRLGKLAIAVGAGIEGGTHSAVRHASEAGITPDEIELSVYIKSENFGRCQSL
jgi:4-carboxymuconolactone decarboxylase